MQRTPKNQNPNNQELETPVLNDPIPDRRIESGQEKPRYKENLRKEAWKEEVYETSEKSIKCMRIRPFTLVVFLLQSFSNKSSLGVSYPGSWE